MEMWWKCQKGFEASEDPAIYVLHELNLWTLEKLRGARAVHERFCRFMSGSYGHYGTGCRMLKHSQAHIQRLHNSWLTGRCPQT